MYIPYLRRTSQGISYWSNFIYYILLFYLLPMTCTHIAMNNFKYFFYHLQLQCSYQFLNMNIFLTIPYPNSNYRHSDHLSKVRCTFPKQSSSFSHHSNQFFALHCYCYIPGRVLTLVFVSFGPQLDSVI